MKIRLVVVDDIESHIRRIQRILRHVEDIEIVATAKNGYDAAVAVAVNKPDIVLMDIEMETNVSGIETAKVIHKQFEDIKIIMLTAHDSTHDISSSFQSGIVDYLLKSSDDETIIESIRQAYNDQSPIRPMIAKKLRTEFYEMKNKEESMLYALSLIAKLTQSELEILILLAKNYSREKIAKLRYVELSTLKKQISSILKKCDKRRTKDLVNILEELKLVSVLEKLVSK